MYNLRDVNYIAGPRLQGVLNRFESTPDLTSRNSKTAVAREVVVHTPTRAMSLLVNSNHSGEGTPSTT